MKPKVICHIMASVDGHIQMERFSVQQKDNGVVWLRYKVNHK